MSANVKSGLSALAVIGSMLMLVVLIGCESQPTPTAGPKPTATAAPVVPTSTATPAATATPSPEPTVTAAPAPTATPSPEPTATATPAPTATPSPEPAATATPAPTATPSPEPTATPAPTATPTPEPTATATPEPTEALDFDPAVVRGTLSNGLSYYIRHNEEPRSRAQIALVVKAGSIDEEEDQRGLAHLAEHMAFNGTERFAKQEIVEYLESIGSTFGADLNARTGFDDTLYWLEIPTDDPEITETAFQILSDWAYAVAFDRRSGGVAPLSGIQLTPSRKLAPIALRLLALLRPESYWPDGGHRERSGRAPQGVLRALVQA